jgi:hypothetical protein
MEPLRCVLRITSSVMRMLGTTWSTRKCHINMVLGVSECYYQTTAHKQTFGIGQGSTSASDIWCIILGILIHTVATYFIGIVFVSVSGFIIHKHVGEGLIYETGLATSMQSSINITPSSTKSLSR